MLTRRQRLRPPLVAAAMIAAGLPVGLAPAVAAGGSDCDINDFQLACTKPGDPGTEPGPGGPGPTDPPADPVVDNPPGNKPPTEEPPGAGPPFAPGYYPMCSPFVAEQPFECWWPYVPTDVNLPTMPTTGREGEAAKRAVDKLRLPAPEIGSAPCTEEGCMGGVGVPVWLWVETPWEPVTAQASLPGGGSIRAVAEPVQTMWDMGDDTQITCDQGTPYSPSYGWMESPDCGHVYQQTSADQPNQRYTVSSNLVWKITITGDENFEFGLSTRSTVQPAVGEYQAVIDTRGGDTP